MIIQNLITLPDIDLTTINSTIISGPMQSTYTRGTTYFELSNHLGNVLAVVTDRKLAQPDGGTGVAFYLPDIVSATDYYPIGFAMEGRGFSSDNYRYGFNGMEKDNELKGSGNSYDFGARLLDVRLGRWLAVDPKFKHSVGFSPYCVNFNSPLVFKDPNGEFPFLVIPILIGLLTVPSVAVAPSLNPELDAIAIEEARQLQNKWLLFSVLSGAGGSMAGYKAIANELGKQFAVQFALNFGNQLIKGQKFDAGEAIRNTLTNIDIGDAIISTMDFDAFSTFIATSMIDITAQEAKALGLGKDAKSVSIDMVFNALATKTQGKVPQGKYADIAKRLINVVEDKAKEIVKESLKESTEADLKEFSKKYPLQLSPTIHEPDALYVNPVPMDPQVPTSVESVENEPSNNTGG